MVGDNNANWKRRTYIKTSKLLITAQNSVWRKALKNKALRWPMLQRKCVQMVSFNTRHWEVGSLLEEFRGYGYMTLWQTRKKLVIKNKIAVVTSMSNEMTDEYMFNWARSVTNKVQGDKSVTKWRTREENRRFVEATSVRNSVCRCKECDKKSGSGDCGIQSVKEESVTNKVWTKIVWQTKCKRMLEKSLDDKSVTKKCWGGNCDKKCGSRDCDKESVRTMSATNI
jgi:hypothetical protein